MSMVRNSLETLSGCPRRILPPAVAVLCCAALLGGCGGSSHSKAASARGVGSSLRLDNCADWRSATTTQRRATVEQLRRFAGGPVGSSAGIQNGPVLSDQTAYKLLGRYCSKPFARGFKLYKLYTHAAAFIGH